MPRRARSSFSAGQFLGLLLVIGLLLGGSLLAYRIFSGQNSGAASLSEGSELDVEDYLENANSLRGNAYLLTGTVDDQLKWTADNGRLFSIAIEEHFLPVLVPAEFDNQNIQLGESFRFKILVGRGGSLIAQALSKS